MVPLLCQDAFYEMTIFRVRRINIQLVGNIF